MMRRLLIAIALVSGCSSGEVPAPEKKVEAPPSEPEEVEPADDGASDQMKMALLGGGKKDKPEDVDQAPDPAAEEAVPPKKPRRKKAQASSEQSRRTLTKSSALPEPPAQLSDSQFEGVVGDWRGVKSCVATNRPRGGEVQNGALSVQFTIAGNGVVEGARVEQASGAFARTLAPCVERKAMRLRFPDFGGKSNVTRSAKFVF
ncbi:MAG: hypothetical protein AAGD10_07545 [Myxococcota bacterium]